MERRPRRGICGASKRCAAGLDAVAARRAHQIAQSSTFFIFATTILSCIAYSTIVMTIYITISPGGNSGPWVWGGAALAGGFETLGTRELHGGTRGQLPFATTAAASLSRPIQRFKCALSRDHRRQQDAGGTARPWAWLARQSPARRGHLLRLPQPERRSGRRKKRAYAEIAALAVAVGATAARSSAVPCPSSTATRRLNYRCATDHRHHRHGRENKWIIPNTAHVDSSGLAIAMIDLAQHWQLGRPGLEQFR